MLVVALVAAPFVVLVLIGVFAGIQRSIKAEQNRERFRQEISEQSRGRH